MAREVGNVGTALLARCERDLRLPLMPHTWKECRQNPFSEAAQWFSHP